jgi:hypothetical protein
MLASTTRTPFEENAMTATMTRTLTVTVPAPIQHSATAPGHGGRFAPEAIAHYSRRGLSALVATCGRALACLPCVASEPDTGVTLIPASALRKLKRGKRGPVPSVTVTDTGVVTPDGVTHPQPDEAFPPVSDAIPAHLGNRIPVAFNADLLASLAASIGAANGKVVVWVDPGNRQPAVVVPDGSNGVGVIMPCSCEDNAATREDVARRLTEAREVTRRI